MGLDITAYSRIVPSANQSPAEDERDQGLIHAWKNPDFPAHAADLVAEFYECHGETHEFCAGGYHGYNHWRNDLAWMAGYPATEVERYGRIVQRHDETVFANPVGPFAELIYFSDCEGVIGPAASAKLAADFAAFQHKADCFAGENPDFFRERYADWRRAFELAAAGGLVQFH